MERFRRQEVTGMQVHEAEDNAVRDMYRLGIGDLLEHKGNELYVLPFDENGTMVMPMLHCDEVEGLFISDRTQMSSFRRAEVFRYGNAVFKTGEQSFARGYHRSHVPISDEVKATANQNLVREARKNLVDFNLGLPIEKIVLMIYNPATQLKYAVFEHSGTTVLDYANSRIQMGDPRHKGVELAVGNFFEETGALGYSYVPHLDRRGRVDLGDLLVSRKEDGSYKVVATDNPSFIDLRFTEIDNHQTYLRVISEFNRKALKHTRK